MEKRKNWHAGSCLGKLAPHFPRLRSHTEGSDNVVNPAFIGSPWPRHSALVRKLFAEPAVS